MQEYDNPQIPAGSEIDSGKQNPKAKCIKDLQGGCTQADFRPQSVDKMHGAKAERTTYHAQKYMQGAVLPKNTMKSILDKATEKRFFTESNQEHLRKE